MAPVANRHLPRIGLTLATVSRTTRGLIASGLIGELPRENDAHDRLGRPPVSLDILPEGGQVLGAVINPAFQGVALSDLKNRTIVEIELDLNSVDDPDLVIERVVDSSRHLMSRFVPDRHRLLGGYVVLSATLDPQHGVVHSSRYLGWKEIPLADRVSELLASPIRLESSPVAMALAETRFGIAQERRNVLVIYCGLGLGTGLIVSGHPVPGHGFTAGGLSTASGLAICDYL